MAFIDFAPAYRPVRSIARVFDAVARRITELRDARAKREALHGLLSGPEHLLSDVGVTRDQLIRLIENYR